jgi:hypothetical protein
MFTKRELNIMRWLIDKEKEDTEGIVFPAEIRIARRRIEAMKRMFNKMAENLETK